MTKILTQISKIFIDNLTMFSRFRGNVELFLIGHIKEFENKYLRKIEEDLKNKEISITKKRWKYPSEDDFLHGETFDLDEYLESIEDEETKRKVKLFFEGQALLQLEKEYEIRKPYTVENMRRFLNEYQFLSLYSEFETYLHRYLKYHIQKNIGILKEKTITLGKIIEKDKNLDLIFEEKTEKTIKDLLKSGNYKKLFHKISEKPYNFEIDLTEDEINRIDEFKQLRHLYVHGDGKADLIYLSKTKNKKIKKGEHIPITRELIYNDFMPLLFNFIEKMDKYLISIHPEMEYRDEVS